MLLLPTYGVSALQLLNVNHSLPGSYIVRLRDGLALEGHVANMTSMEGFALHRQYSFLAQHGFPAYSANLTEAALDNVLGHPDVAYVEENGVATLFGGEAPTCDTRQDNPHNWGISRISARAEWSGTPFPNSNDRNPDYAYNAGAAGKGVYAFVLDTGIECNNADFDERCLTGVSFVEGEGGVGDFQGHGTHCSSILGGIVYGVAKQVFLQPVKVLTTRAQRALGEVISMHGSRLALIRPSTHRTSTLDS